MTKEERRTTDPVLSHPHLRMLTTSIPVDWAELVTLDLSKFDQPGGKEELVKELEREYFLARISRSLCCSSKSSQP